MERWLEWTLYGLCGLLLLLLLVGLIADATADRFSLKKAEWVCTKSHEETQTTVAIINGGIYPNTTTKTVCDRWERKQ